MRKGDDNEEEKKKKKIKTFLVATNVVASRPPERRPTATPTARAKMMVIGSHGWYFMQKWFLISIVVFLLIFMGEKNYSKINN